MAHERYERSHAQRTSGQQPQAAPRDVHAVPTNAELKVTRALEVFNASEQPRTIGGIVRSLGLPSVSAGTSANSSTEVRVTVAWELSWYQWVVDLSDGDGPVRLVSHGNEVSELDGPAREWNAHASEDGTLYPGLPEEDQPLAYS